MLLATTAFSAISVFAETRGVVHEFSIRPSFVREPIMAAVDRGSNAKQGGEGLLIILDEKEFSPEQVRVTDVIEASSLPLVVLDAGYNKNIRPGMLCLVEQDGQAISLLVIAESDVSQAIGLIFTLADPATIQPGDRVQIKTVHFN